MSATAQATPAVAETALSAKVKAMREEAAKASLLAKRVLTELSHDNVEAAVTFNMQEFIAAIGKSSTGETEGVKLDINGNFTANVPGVGEVTIHIEAMAWTKARIVLPQV